MEEKLSILIGGLISAWLKAKLLHTYCNVVGDYRRGSSWQCIVGSNEDRSKRRKSEITSAIIRYRDRLQSLGYWENG